MTCHTPFTVEVDSAAVTDLRARLGAARWPDELPAAGWDYGMPRDILRDLCAAWQQHDIDAFVARCNRWPQVRGTYELDGTKVQVHAVHARSPHPGARPIVLVHGWPGSIVEYLHLIDQFIDPPDPADAFHVIVPSLPGYGFSGVTTATGVDATVAGDAIDALLADLGYDEYLLFGGDWGSVIGLTMAIRHPDRLRAFHQTMVRVPVPPKDERDSMITDADRVNLDRARQFTATGIGYQAIQSTRPQSLTYGLHDSPVGLAAWIGEKFHEWTDRSDDLADAPFGAVPIDQLLDNLSMYWFTGTIGSSMRLYYETIGAHGRPQSGSTQVPFGYTQYPAEIYASPRGFVERAMNLEYWKVQPRGGHFPSLEVPDLFVPDVRARFRAYR